MSLRFATIGRRPCAVIARVLHVPPQPCAANDDAVAVQGQEFFRRVLLRDALRHFAAHGAGAAERARRNAEQAFFADQRAEYLHWMAICRALDRGMVERT